MKRSAGSWIRQMLIILLLAANACVWGKAIILEARKPEPVMGVDYYPMANQHIEWTYAGK